MRILRIYPGAMIVMRMIATEVIENLIYGPPALRVVVSRSVVVVSREFTACASQNSAS